MLLNNIAHYRSFAYNIIYYTLFVKRKMIITQFFPYSPDFLSHLLRVLLRGYRRTTRNPMG